MYYTTLVGSQFGHTRDHSLCDQIMNSQRMLKFNESAVSPQTCSLQCSMARNIKCRYERVTHLDLLVHCCLYLCLGSIGVCV